MAKSNVTSTKTKRFFYNICQFCFFCLAPNYYFEELQLPEFVIKIFNSLSKFVKVLACLLFLFEWAAMFTQPNLTEKQSSDRTLFCVSHPVLTSFFYSMESNKDKVTKLLLNLVVDLKGVYNDTDVEQEMIKKIKFYCAAYLSLFGSTLLMYGVDGFMRTLATDVTFTTVIPAWPDVEDRRAIAGCARVAIYIVWWLHMTRVSTAYTILMSTNICLSHQYKQLHSYFHSLNDIFEKDHLEQRQKELEYENAIKVGIQLHSDTLVCTKMSQDIGNVVFSGQIIINTTLLGLLVTQLVNTERTLSSTLTIAATFTALLISTGFVMWNAGDITVEASHLPTAMYSSGWQHCHRKSAGRVRKLLVIAMARSQVPANLQCLGVVQLSYSSYVSIVKSSYSIFSVLY